MKFIISRSKEMISTIIAGVVIAITSAIILDYIYADTGPDETLVLSQVEPKHSSTPQLWSHHKLLDISADQCATNGKAILTTLGFISIVMNNNYVYGNFKGNRAVIKCVDIANKAFVYTAVAGADVAVVEKLRNEIAWKLSY